MITDPSVAANIAHQRAHRNAKADAATPTCGFIGHGALTMNTNSPSYYGNLARVAIGFYCANGHAGELVLVYWYARYAARSAAERGR